MLHKMLYMWRFAMWILCCGLWVWASTTPASAHHSNVASLEATYPGSSNPGFHPTATNAVLPQNFIARTVVSGLTLPTDMAILPSGDILIAEKGLGAGPASKADVRFVRNGVLQPATVITLGVNSEEDSGLLGIVLDPNFALNGYFYVWYSTGEDSLGWDGITYNRLSRFFLDVTTGKADPATETIILDKVTWGSIHNGGGMAFDAEGNLLLTTGDATINQFSPQVNLAQQLNSLSGKVLRIRPLPGGGYAVPDDNPFVGNVEGIRPEIYAYGLRNPFRVVQRAADQRFYLIDVGHDTWEEVNLLQAGANYGWPIREGKCPLAVMQNCSPTPADFVDPLVTYLHPEGSGAGFTALAFYEGSAWPQPFLGRLFVADFNSDWVGMANVDLVDPPITRFASDLGAVVDMEASDEGIFVLSIVSGSIKFIYYDVESNQPPSATWTVGPKAGVGPLRVSFTATAVDANNDDLVYVWDFGDGIQVTTTLPSVAHVYELDGDYLTTLQVVDEDDGKSEILSQLVQVYSGAQPNIVQENLAAPGRSLYWGGDEFRFSVAREGGEEGLDPDAPYAWTILLHHNEHAHYLLAEYISDEVRLEIPLKTHALGAPLWYEVRLTMQTESGQKIVRSLNVLAQTTTIQVQSWPGPAGVMIEQQVQDPANLTLVVVGQEYVLEAPERIVYQGKVGRFANWVVTPSWPQASAMEDAVIVNERVYTLMAPAEANSYVAFYEFSGTANTNYLPTVSK